MSSVDEYIRSLGRLPPGTQRDDLQRVTEEALTIDGVPGRVSRKSFLAERVFQSIAVLNPNAAMLFPGNVIKGEGLLRGALNPLNVDLDGTTITLSGLRFKQRNAKYSSTIKQTTKETVDGALSALLDQGEAGTAAQLAYSYFRSYSLEHLAVSLGAAYESTSFSVDLSAKFEQMERNNVFVVKLLQPYYTVSTQAKNSPSAYFRKPDLKRIKDAVGAGNPPLYLGDVKYGRMLVFVLRSTLSDTSMEAAIKASYGSMVSSGRMNLDVATRKTLAALDISALVLGGPAGASVEALAARPGADIADAIEATLSDLLRAGKEWSAASPAVPIAYTARYLADNTDADVKLVGTYERNDWSSARWTSLTLKGYTFNDDKRPEVVIHAAITKDGRTLAYGSIGKIRLYEESDWSTRLDMPEPLSGRDLAGSQVDIRMEGGDDDWRMNWSVVGTLEGEQQVRSLGGDPNQHELNDRQPAKGYLGGGF